MDGQGQVAVGRTASWRVATLDEEWLWLLAAVATTTVVYLIYLATHPFPAYAGGLYLVIAERIVENGYALPTRIPGYTRDGVPFAYPPLMFYVTAVIIDATAVEPLAITRYLPGLVVVACVVPYFGIARELVGDPRLAGLAAILLGSTPTTLRWHLSAGGIVRAPAFLLALVGAYTAVKLYRTRERRWLAAATAVFGLLVMTHPTYAAFLGLTHLLFAAWFDHTLHGLRNGAIVAVGGVLIAGPWWLQVVDTHGVGIFTTAAGTHGGLAGGPTRLAVQLTYPLNDFDIEWPFYIGAFLGGGYALWTRRYLLPAWMVASSYVIGKNRFLFVAGSMLTAVFVFEAVLPRIRRFEISTVRGRQTTLAALGLVILAAVAGGGLYTSGAVPAAHSHSDAQPAYLDHEDMDAMRWVERHTAGSSRFVVLGDSAEWFPFYTDRAILLGFWGVEWESTRGYYHQVKLFDAISGCDSASCISGWLVTEGYRPDYVYIPKGQYTVRGKEHIQSPTMQRSLRASNRYNVVYENGGVIIARVDGSLDDHEADAGVVRVTP